MRTDRLFQKHYFSQPWYVSGTLRFHEMIRAHSPENPSILEIGAGPKNTTSDFLASLGVVNGLDVDSDVLSNPALSHAEVFDGRQFPFPDCSFDLCVSNYVLEHVADCEMHFREVARVLRPGGFYFFRTPNLWHYVTFCSRVLPHALHLRLANKLRGLKGAHDPYPTCYRANSRAALVRLSAIAGLKPCRLDMIEPEPSYGRAHSLLFYVFMGYERLVNRFHGMSALRANILGVLKKSAQ